MTPYLGVVAALLEKDSRWKAFHIRKLLVDELLVKPAIVFLFSRRKHLQGDNQFLSNRLLRQRTLKTVGTQHQDMSNTYVLTIVIESYEFSGEFYFVGDGYGTGEEVLKHVVTDHILAMKQHPHVAEYLLETLQDGENVSESKYKQVDPDVSCGLHFDVDHHRFRFWIGDHTVDIGSQPTKRELRSIAEDLPM